MMARSYPVGAGRRVERRCELCPDHAVAGDFRIRFVEDVFDGARLERRDGATTGEPVGTISEALDRAAALLDDMRRSGNHPQGRLVDFEAELSELRAIWGTPR